MYRSLLVCLFMMGVATNIAYAQINFNAKIKVLDQYSMPVANALVLIGAELHIPFTNNLFIADAAGEVIVPHLWMSTEPLTVDAAGFIRQTLLNQSPSDIVIHLNPLHLNPQISVSGNITNLPVVNKDKMVEFAVVATPFTQNDFIHISQEQFISPYADNLSLIGKVVPVFSNVSIPEQKENYVIPLTLSKPTYTKFFYTTGNIKLISMSGKFPLKQVADELKEGKPFFDVISYFEFLSLGSIDINLTQSVTGVNFSGATLPLNTTTQIVAPVLAANEQALVFPMNAVLNYYLPSGIKKLNSAESALFNTLNQAEISLLMMIKRSPDFSISNDQARLSAFFVKPNDSTVSLYLPLIEDPTAQSIYPVSVTTPPFSAPSGLFASGTMAVLSQVTETTYNQQLIPVINPKWEVYSLNWEHKIQLPKWPLDIALPKAIAMTFETTYFAQGQAPQNSHVKSMLNQATHLTKSAVNLQY